MAEYQIVHFPPVLRLAVFIVAYAGDERLGTGTGFVVGEPGSRFLVSNRHVVVGRKPGSNEYQDSRGRQPTRIQVISLDERFTTAEADIPIFTEDREPLWFEHPTLMHELDLVCLPVDDDLHQHTPTERMHVLEMPVRITVTDPVIVTGFPLGFHGGFRGLPVAVTGMIATHPKLSVDADDRLPRFLIDSRTRAGLSGAPVFFYPNGQMVITESGTTVANSPRKSFELLGIYCGRVHEQADLGYVISTTAIKQMIANPKRGVLHAE